MLLNDETTIKYVKNDDNLSMRFVIVVENFSAYDWNA